MSARRMCRVIFTLPTVLLAIGCASLDLSPIPTTPLTLDRMMSIGQTFESQGRFAEAQMVYQEILEIDPVSPAAERLLAVIAAADVTNAQDQPIERLMSVGEFYERNGNVKLAQGVYKKILERQADYDPARIRLNAIALHAAAKPGSGPGGPGKSSSGRTITPLASIALKRPPRDGAASVESFGIADSRQPTIVGVKMEVPETHGLTPGESTLVNSLPSAGSGNGHTPANDSLGAGSDFVTFESQAVSIASRDSFVPPSPSDLPAPTLPPSPKMVTGIDTRISEDRSRALWQDKPLNELKASITLTFPATEPLRETERRRLTQAAPHLASSGSITHAAGQCRPWMLMNYEWEAPATRHLPLFFEEPNVERLGYTYGFYWNICGHESGPCAAECLQPIVSGVNFFGRIAMIPYICGIDPPCEPVYTLGVDRPGSPVPYRKHLVPISLSGVVYQAGTVVGIGYLIP